MKKLFITLAAIVVMLLIALVAIADHALEMAIHPDNNKTRDIALCYSKVYNAYPELEQWHDSLVANGLWRDTMLVAGDGSMRHGLILQHDSVPTGASIVVHGYTDNAPIMLRYVYLHYEVLGRNVVVPEHYAHGESDGDDIRFGWLDRLDIRDLWLPLTHQLWHDQNIVVHGLSMGGAITMFLSGEAIPDSLRLSAFIEDCGYTSTWDQLSYQAEEMGFPAFPVLDVANIICRHRYGWDMKESNALAQLAKCTRPMLFIHGDADDYVPTEMVYRNYDAKISGYKELMVVPGAKHARSIHEAWDDYVRRVESFLAKVEQ